MDGQRRATLPRLTDRVGLGPLSVSPFCLGMVDSPTAVAEAFARGSNFFFLSADMHWPRYEAARIGLEEVLSRVERDAVVVAAAAYVTQPEFCREPFRELVAAVKGLERIDVLVAGGAYEGELARRLPIYLRHREDGFVGARAIGVSFHDRGAARAAIADGGIDVAFVRYNTAHPGAREDVFPFLPASRTTRVFGFTSTGGYRDVVDEDVWIPEVTDHYRFALSSGALDGILCSPTTPAQVGALVEAMEEEPLSLAEEEHMIELALRSA
jgi:hypothetical protein